MDQSWIWKGARPIGGSVSALRDAAPPIRIGLALVGGFARGIAHAGVLKVFERHRIPIHCITGVSAGSIVAAAYASGATPDEIARSGCSMRFGDIGRWKLNRLGLVGSERMTGFLKRLLKTHRFEEMHIPLGVVATDLSTGRPVAFSGAGKVFDPIRASCSYPGLFQPVRHQERFLVDGAISQEIPAGLARRLGATHVISVYLPAPDQTGQPASVFHVVNRCFQILQRRAEANWRHETDLVIAPAVAGIEWDGFGHGEQLIEAGQAAAFAALPEIQIWLGRLDDGPKPSLGGVGKLMGPPCEWGLGATFALGSGERHSHRAQAR